MAPRVLFACVDRAIAGAAAFSAQNERRENSMPEVLDVFGGAA
jgi:hypothetical protein